MDKETRNKLRSILEAVTAHDKYKTFEKPVPKKLAPDYYDIIKEPMHFKMVRAKLEKGEYSNPSDFKRVRPAQWRIIIVSLCTCFLTPRFHGRCSSNLMRNLPGGQGALSIAARCRRTWT